MYAKMRYINSTADKSVSSIRQEQVHAIHKYNNEIADNHAAHNFIRHVGMAIIILFLPIN